MTMLATKIAGAFLATAMVAGGAAAAAAHVTADDQVAADLGATAGTDVDIDIGLGADAGASQSGPEATDAGQDGIADDGFQTPATTGECDGQSGEGSDGTGTTGNDRTPGTEATDSGMITVGQAGTLDAALGQDGLVLTNLDANAGFTAEVVAETPDAIIVEFTGEGNTTSVLIANLDGSLTAFIDSDVAPIVSAEASAEAGLQIDANADLDPALNALLDAWLQLALKS